MQHRPLSPTGRPQHWDDDVDVDAEPAVALRWTREQAQAWRERHPSLNPWRVVAAQLLVGVLGAVSIGLVFGMQQHGWSALYGAATVVVPAALMARGMTSRLSGVSLGVAAVSFMTWEMAKIAVSVAMLMLAPRLVQPLSWPALLAGLVLCIKVYWVALSWRGTGVKR